MTTPGPVDDAAIPAYLGLLGVPGIADIHVHFMPESVLAKVWAYFDQAPGTYGRDWPIHYRLDEDARLATLRSFGLRAIPALNYPHKPGMARWLNGWSAEFARRVPGAVHCATLYPELDVAAYVDEALADGARLFKMHTQVGRYAPDDPLLEGAWRLLERAGVPIVIHAGSAPLPGEFTGPGRVRRVLESHPDLALVVAHLGMPEYDAFADLALEFAHVHLDTTMAATDFTEAFAPLPPGYRDRLADVGDKVVFGSDFPNIPYPYSHQIEALTRLDLGDDWMRSVLWDNGARLLGLSTSSTPGTDRARLETIRQIEHGRGVRMES